jgi:hypothetical protein
MSTDVPACQCPHCFYMFDRASDLAGEAVPVPGNWTICINCASVLRFKEDMTVRAIDEMERAQLEASPAWPEFERLTNGIRTIRSKRHPR